MMHDIYRELPLYKLISLKQEKKGKMRSMLHLISHLILFATIVCDEWTELNCTGEAAPDDLEEHSMVAHQVQTPISLLILHCFLCQCVRYIHRLRPFSGLSVRVRRHAGFCVHTVEMSPLGVWHWWVSLHGTSTALFAASVGIFSTNAQAWQMKPVVACWFRSHASKPLWKYSAPVGQLCVKPVSQMIC